MLRVSWPGNTYPTSHTARRASFRRVLSGTETRRFCVASPLPCVSQSAERAQPVLSRCSSSLLFTLPHTVAELTPVSPEVVPGSQAPSLCAWCPLTWSSLSLVRPPTVVSPFFPVHCGQSNGFFAQKGGEDSCCHSGTRGPHPAPAGGTQGCALARLLSARRPSLRSPRRGLNGTLPASPPATQRGSEIGAFS